MLNQTAVPSLSPERYHTLTIILHWIMALAFAAMLGSGLTLEDMEGPSALKTALFSFHKSMGVLLLLSVFLRLLLRFVFKAPEMPAAFPQWEIRAAKAGHAALYFLMMAIPLTGWLAVSSHPRGMAFDVFGIFTWPLIPGIVPSEALNDVAGEMHEVLAKIFMAVIALHVGAVVWHAVKEKEFLMRRMWWTRTISG